METQEEIFNGTVQESYQNLKNYVTDFKVMPYVTPETRAEYNPPGGVAKYYVSSSFNDDENFSKLAAVSDKLVLATITLVEYYFTKAGIQINIPKDFRLRPMLDDKGFESPYIAGSYEKEALFIRHMRDVEAGVSFAAVNIDRDRLPEEFYKFKTSDFDARYAHSVIQTIIHETMHHVQNALKQYTKTDPITSRLIEEGFPVFLTDYIESHTYKDSIVNDMIEKRVVTNNHSIFMQRLYDYYDAKKSEEFNKLSKPLLMRPSVKKVVLEGREAFNINTPSLSLLIDSGLFDKNLLLKMSFDKSFDMAVGAALFGMLHLANKKNISDTLIEVYMVDYTIDSLYDLADIAFKKITI